MYFKKF